MQHQKIVNLIGSLPRRAIMLRNGIRSRTLRDGLTRIRPPQRAEPAREAPHERVACCTSGSRRRVLWSAFRQAARGSGAAAPWRTTARLRLTEWPLWQFIYHSRNGKPAGIAFRDPFGEGWAGIR